MKIKTFWKAMQRNESSFKICTKGTNGKKKKSWSEEATCGRSRGRSPPYAEGNTIFSTLKMQYQGLLTHRLLGFSTNATSNFTRRGKSLLFFYTFQIQRNLSIATSLRTNNICQAEVWLFWGFHDGRQIGVSRLS